MPGRGAPYAPSTSRAPKAARAVDGEAPVKRDRYVPLTGVTKLVDPSSQTPSAQVTTNSMAQWSAEDFARSCTLADLFDFDRADAL